jgi:hypothetical protein
MTAWSAICNEHVETRGVASTLDYNLQITACSKQIECRIVKTIWETFFFFRFVAFLHGVRKGAKNVCETLLQFAKTTDGICEGYGDQVLSPMTDLWMVQTFTKRKNFNRWQWEVWPTFNFEKRKEVIQGKLSESSGTYEGWGIKKANGNMDSRRWHLHHNNAPRHTALPIREFLAKHSSSALL